MITRLPYSSTRPKILSIMNEVGTIKFLWLHGLLIPLIYDRSSSASNSINTEYITMEKVHGTELQSLWYSMDVQQRRDIVSKIINLEKKLFAIPLPANRSIYFKNFKAIENADKIDIATDITQNKFCVGPSTEYF